MIEKRHFGKTDMVVSALGLGGAEIGYESATDRAVDGILGEALDAGINVIDTAAMYPNSEEIVGRALRGRRNSFLLFTKCGAELPPKSTIAGFMARAHRKARNVLGAGGDGGPYWYAPFYWHPRVLRWNIEQSLIRLRTDRLDLIQLHSCSEDTLRRGDVIEVLKRARETGKARYIGYSGDGPAALYAIRCGQFDAVQTSINIADQEAIERTVPLAAERGMGVIAKRPIANGVWTYLEKPENPHLHAYWIRLRELCYDCLRDDGARGFEMALRFTLAVPGVSTAIVGTAALAHFRQNVTFATAGRLDQREFDAVRLHWRRMARPDWIGQT